MEYDVELVDVTKRYGDVTAVDKVSLKVGKGEFFSVVGPSGSGKTTMLRLIAGFEYPDSGDIYIKGEMMGRKPSFERPHKVMVFQNLALFPHMNVFDNLAYGLKIRKIPCLLYTSDAADE